MSSHCLDLYAVWNCSRANQYLSKRTSLPINSGIATHFFEIIADQHLVMRVFAGVWLLHCHLEMHLSWGMEMAFVVRNGLGDNETLPSPPADYPRCVKHHSTPH